MLDPFAGSGTVGHVARQHGRHSILIELNEQYCRLIAERTQQLGPARMSQHWKNMERKKCRDMGGQRKGQIGPDGYARGTTTTAAIWCSLEVKYVNRYTLRQSWIDQARATASTTAGRG